MTKIVLHLRVITYNKLFLRKGPKKIVLNRCTPFQ